MIIDLNIVDKNFNFPKYDICIVGAGAAGISIAQRLINYKINVCLIEAGGFNFSEESQSIYSGTWINDIFKKKNKIDNRLETDRLRFFGGSTNHWVGRCRRLDKIDFEKRQWIPNSGWPIEFEKLSNYYKEAEKILELQKLDYEDENKSESIIGDYIKKRQFTFSPPVRMGKKYKDDFKKSKNLTLILNCNFNKLIYKEFSGTISGLICSNFQEKKFNLSFNQIVFASGGVENNRFMLNEKINYNLKNKNIGRYFMGHAIWEIGVLFSSDDFNIKPFLKKINNSFLSFIFSDTSKIYRKIQLKLGFKDLGPNLNRLTEENRPNQDFFAIREEIQRKYNLPNMGITIESEYEPSNLDLSNISVIKSLRDIKMDQFNSRKLLLRAEQVPNYQSCIKILKDKDKLGMYKSEVIWALNDLDLQSMKKFNQLLSIDFERSKIGIFKNLFDEDKVPENLWSGAHHLGGTRMSDSEDDGVVDYNSKVFELNNLYIAGGSVFPTSGLANPTLTIVALSLRLADHLKSKYKN